MLISILFDDCVATSKVKNNGEISSFFFCIIARLIEISLIAIRSLIRVSQKTRRDNDNLITPPYQTKVFKNLGLKSKSCKIQSKNLKHLIVSLQFVSNHQKIKCVFVILSNISENWSPSMNKNHRFSHLNVFIVSRAPFRNLLYVIFLFLVPLEIQKVVCRHLESKPTQI